jgi:hypothetical protein
MRPIQILSFIALVCAASPASGIAQNIRRTPLDSVVIRPPALADSAPVYRAVLSGMLDSLLALTSNSRYYIEIPHEALPAATQLLPPLVRAGRARGWCVWDRKDSCLSRGHLAIRFGRLVLHTTDSASVPFTTGREEDRDRRTTRNTADDWLMWRAMEVGIWPAPVTITGGVLYPVQLPEITLRHNLSGWTVVALLSVRPARLEFKEQIDHIDSLEDR